MLNLNSILGFYGFNSLLDILTFLDLQGDILLGSCRFQISFIFEVFKIIVSASFFIGSKMHFKNLKNYAVII